MQIMICYLNNDINKEYNDSVEIIIKGQQATKDK